MSTTLSKFYQVCKKKVTLKITIGKRQVGVTSVNLDDKQLVHQHRNALSLSLGSGKKLIHKTLFCVTTVTDIRTETNETKITYELMGGIRPFKQTLHETVESAAAVGGVVFYLATFRFYL